MRMHAIAFAAALGIAAAAASARAGTITFSGDQHQTGTGIGATLHVLEIQHNVSEWGYVGWNYATDADEFDGDTKSHSNTVTVAEVQTDDPSHGYVYDEDGLGLLLNIAQHGHADTIELTRFDLLLYDVSAETVETISWTGNLSLHPSGHGVGHSGYFFRVEGIHDFLADDPLNRFGLRVPESSPFTDTNDGPEIFFFGSFPVAIPLPPTVWLGLSGLGAMALFLRRRRSPV